MTHKRINSEGTTAPILAAVEALEPEDQEVVRQRINDLLRASSSERHSRGTRRAAAVRALNEATEILGAPPSAGALEATRARHPEFDWPPARSIKRWLGVGAWNEALEEAGLPVVPFLDLGAPELGPTFTAEEALSALRECIDDLGRRASVNDYTYWAHRKDVSSRPGRRPKTHAPFLRLFGTWAAALEAATGKAEDIGLENDSGHVVSAGFRVSDEKMWAALRDVGTRVGHSPTTGDYTHQRELIWRTEQRAIPSVSTILRRFRTWDEALATAGLEPRMGRPVTGRRGGPKGPWLTREVALAAMVEALQALGDDLCARTYVQWRRAQLAADFSRARSLPSLSTILLRFGTWSVGLEAAKSLLATTAADGSR